MTNAVDDYDDLLDDGNHRWRKRLILSALVAALAVAGVFVLWATMLRGGGPAESAVQTAKVQRGSIMKTISTSATTASQATANLSFGSSGKVTAVNVSVGQEVKQGDVLAEVESTTLQDALTRAQVGLASAQRSLNKLLESPTTADKASADQSVIQAEANLDKANAALEDLYDGPTTEERDSAQQSVLNAESQLAKAQTARANVDTAWSNAVAAAEAAVEKAQTALDKAESSAGDAADALSLAEAKLEGAENSYCASDNSPSFCTSNATPISSSDESDLLTLASEGNQQAPNVLSANNAYKTARSAKSNAEDAVDQAEADLQTAEDNLDELGSGPSSDDIASADAAVESAQLALKMANDKLVDLDQAPSEDDVTQAQHNVDSAAAALTAAQAKRDETYQGSKQEDIDAQEDQVRLAQLSVNEAKKDLEKAQIIAPFDGTVAALNITVGDSSGSSTSSSSTSSSSSSSSSAAIVLNTPNALVLNLSIGESDLPSVKAGQSGTATFDAISGRIFPITIDTVGTNPTTTQGVVTYQARARIVTRDSARAAATAQSASASSGQAPSAAQAQASSDATTTAEPVPGMNASVTIIIDQAQDVLTVPATAVQTEGRSKYVTVQKDDGSKEKVTVETGLSDDSNTEITSGLEEGQTVIIPGATSTSSSSGQDTSSQQTNPFFGGGPPGGFPGGD